MNHLDKEEYDQVSLIHQEMQKLLVKSVPKQSESCNYFGCFKVNSAFLEQQKLIKQTSRENRVMNIPRSKTKKSSSSSQSKLSASHLKIRVIDAENIMKT